MSFDPTRKRIKKKIKKSIRMNLSNNVENRLSFFRHKIIWSRFYSSSPPGRPNEHLPRSIYLNVITMASTEDTAATGAAAAATNTAGGMHSMYAEAVEQYEASVAAAAARSDEGGQAAGKPSNTAADDMTTTGEPKKSKPRGHVPWQLAKELPSPEGDANPWNRSGGGRPVSQLP